MNPPGVLSRDMPEPLVYTEAWLATLPLTVGDSSPLAHRFARFPRPPHQGLRDQIERLIANAPLKKQADLIGRLRGKRDDGVNGALAELLVAGALWKLGCAVTWEPEVGSQTPDLHVTDARGSGELLELAAVSAGGKSAARAQEHARVVDALTQIQSVHGVALDGTVVAPGGVSLKDFVTSVKSELAAIEGIDPAGAARVPRREWTRIYAVDRVSVRYAISPFLRSAPAPCYVGGHQVTVGNPVAEQIPDAFNGKVKKYKFGFVLGIVVSSTATPWGLWSIEKAIYGAPYISIPVGPAEPSRDVETGRKPNGLLRERAGHLNSNRRVKAVLGITLGGLTDADGLSVGMRVYPNPFATEPLADDFLEGVSRVRIVRDAAGDAVGIDGLEEPGTVVVP